MRTKRTFREQMLDMLKKRNTSEIDKENIERDLAEATTQAAEAVITYMRQWPGQFPTSDHAVGRMLEGDKWNDNGTMDIEKDHKGRNYPLRMSLELAYSRYRYGYQTKQYFPSFSFPSGVRRIPANMTEDWAEHIKELFRNITNVSSSAIKIISLGKWVKSYGVTNPHTYSLWNNDMHYWKEAVEAIDKFVENRPGWEYIHSKKQQDLQHKIEMSKVLEDILAKADERIEPAIKAIKEQDRRLYIRRDATYARNNVSSLNEFFGKYGADHSGLTKWVSGAIDVVETESLKTK